MAKIPDKGPSPIKITKKIAQIRLGRLLPAAKMNLAKYEILAEFRFLAARSAIGRDRIIPRIVETNAILIVSVIPIQAVEQVKLNGSGVVHTGYACASRTVQSGGHKD